MGLVAVLVGSPTWAVVTDRLGLLVVPLAAGFVAQVLLGAMSYLVPVVLGGGPAIVRGTQARLERGNALRVLLINAGLVVCVLPVPASCGSSSRCSYWAGSPRSCRCFSRRSCMPGVTN